MASSLEAASPPRTNADLTKKDPGEEAPPFWSAQSKWHRVRIVVAIIFAVATFAYSAIWMYYIRFEPKAEFRFGFEPNFQEHYLEITSVAPGGPASQAGLQPGERVLSINGHAIRSPKPYMTVTFGGRPGDRVTLQVQTPNVGTARSVEVILVQPDAQSRTVSQWIVHELLSSFPVLFVLVGIPLIFLRIDDRAAWLTAICFAGLVASAPLEQLTGLMPAGVSNFALTYMMVFFALAPTSMYWLFATFPAQSPLDSRVPWLKYLMLIAAASVAIPLACAVLITGSMDPLWPVLDRLASRGIGYLFGSYFFIGYGLALISLLGNSLRAPTAEVRRKTRVMAWGTFAGMLPWFVLQVIVAYRHISPYQLPFWAWATAVIAMFLMPLSFAYAVVKHRVLEIPVLLRRSARYLLVQRGFLILMLAIGIAATLALAHSFTRHFPASAGAAIPVGVAFGMVLVGGGTWAQQRVSTQVDRAFFRSSYDTRQILENLVEKTRAVRTREQLSELLERNLAEALHPSFLLSYFEEHGSFALRSGGEVVAAPAVLPQDSVLADEAFARAAPIEITPLSGDDVFVKIHAECLVPVAGRDGQRLGLLVLGLRKSEEPYSGEDRRLLSVIANQAGNTLENIRLGEEIAERVEAGKRAAHEIELARQVQRKLFPQHPPYLDSLDYAGDCVQARVVGGDYYDFIELAPGLLGFALADISGKGFPAALLMANLQANLRGQYALARDDLAGLLRSVNGLFYENTEPNHYATMFFGRYDDQRRELQYVNCGHNPALVVRADNSVEWLDSTATVMGMFPEWICEVSKLQLNAGDAFLIYTDGLTEATSPEGDEFGGDRLCETLQRNRALTAAPLLQVLLKTVQRFSPGEPGDDMTAVVAKVR
jgi:sigma-B regulation protein RsbU (phosphoserine phosphatase)